MSPSQSFLVLVPKLIVSLQYASPLSPLISPPPQHLANLKAVIILALKGGRQHVWALGNHGVLMGFASPQAEN